jgi:hypothetical protein
MIRASLLDESDRGKAHGVFAPQYVQEAFA